MKPVLFSIFGMKINGYGTMIALGIICAYLLFQYRTRKSKYNQDKLLNMVLLGVIVGLLGAKLLYILINIKDIINNFNLTVIGMGFVVYGGIISGIATVYFYCKSQKWNYRKIFDLAMPSIAIAQGFGRIGCLLAGCCYGKPTNSIIGIVFHKSLYAPSGVKLFPTEIISSAFDFGLALFLLLYSKKNKKDGMIFALYVIIYSIGRFIVEFFRGDLERGFIGALSTSQFISIIVVIIGVFLVCYYNKLSKQKSEE